MCVRVHRSVCTHVECVWLRIIAQTVISAVHTLSFLPIIQKSRAEELKCGCSHCCWCSSADRTAVPPPQSEVKIAIRTWTTDGGRHFNIILIFTAAGNCLRTVQSSSVSLKVPVSAPKAMKRASYRVVTMRRPRRKQRS